MKQNKNGNVCERNFKEDFSKNCLGVTSNRSLRMRTMTVSELSSNSPRRVVQYFYRNSVLSFQEQKAFVVKIGYFYSHIGLGMCEGVGEDSRHRFGQVDIRAGS